MSERKYRLVIASTALLENLPIKVPNVIKVIFRNCPSDVYGEHGLLSLGDAFRLYSQESKRIGNCQVIDVEEVVV